jgi:hypothetical protein
MKDEILKLRADGLSYKQIEKQLGCSRSTIAYHCGVGQKDKNKARGEKNRKKNPLGRKLERFFYDVDYIVLSNANFKNSSEKLFKKKVWSFMKTSYNPVKFTVEDVKNKIGDNPICYLTGDIIDLNKTSSYNFDHIIPRSRGGESSLENLGLCTKEVNFSKRDMTPDEYINLCKKVLEHNGYKVEKS